MLGQNTETIKDAINSSSAVRPHSNSSAISSDQTYDHKHSKPLVTAIEEEASSSPSCTDLPAHYHIDKKYRATRSEIWSYYTYFIGNSGATLSNFAPTAFQNLLSQASGDSGVLPFAGR